MSQFPNAQDDIIRLFLFVWPTGQIQNLIQNRENQQILAPTIEAGIEKHLEFLRKKKRKRTKSFMKTVAD